MSIIIVFMHEPESFDSNEKLIQQLSLETTAANDKDGTWRYYEKFYRGERMST